MARGRPRSRSTRPLRHPERGQGDHRRVNHHCPLVARDRNRDDQLVRDGMACVGRDAARHLAAVDRDRRGRPSERAGKRTRPALDGATTPATAGTSTRSGFRWYPDHPRTPHMQSARRIAGSREGLGVSCQPATARASVPGRHGGLGQRSPGPCHGLASNDHGADTVQRQRRQPRS
jgi:hypothetical protein